MNPEPYHVLGACWDDKLGRQLPGDDWDGSFDLWGGHLTRCEVASHAAGQGTAAQRRL